ncbi:MAG: N-acetyl-gamma-glutamyl-phosphate reductase [Acidiferrobacterales bacterium]
MNTYNIFIDGEHGTTGLQIRERLRKHPNINIVSIDHDKRRDPDSKRRIMSRVDVTILCLPDDAARDAAVLAEDAGCRVLDASSAHRTADDWVFGMPELCSGQRAAIRDARKVSNPGCYSTGAILLLRPLVDARLLAATVPYPITAISGYTGGGNKLIEKYEGTSTPPSHATYGLDFCHKHIQEIKKWSNLEALPFFLPSVGDFRQGMLVFIQIAHAAEQGGRSFHEALRRHYEDESLVQIQPYNEIDPVTAPFITPHGMEGTDQALLSVFGSAEANKSLLVAKLDNLGKGASGAAVQNLNVMLGLNERTATSLV